MGYERIPFDEEIAAEAREIKQEHRDTWTDVLAYYIENKGDESDLEYDDVVAAASEAIEKELPVEDMRL